MRKFLIFLCILTVSFIAFFDAKDRFKELEEVAANTPSQVEMKQMINRPDSMLNRSADIPKPYNVQNDDAKNLHKKMMQGNEQLKQKYENVDKRRETIQKQTN